MLLWNVHSQLDELPHRSHRSRIAWQRDRPGHPYPPHRALQESGQTAGRELYALLRRRRRKRTSAQHSRQSGLLQRHGLGHSHGRFDQHGAAPARSGPRGRGGLQYGGYRRHLPQGSLPLQSLAEHGEIPRTGRQPCRRHRQHNETAGGRRPGGHFTSQGGRDEPGGRNRILVHRESRRVRGGPGDLQLRSGRTLQHGNGKSERTLRFL